MERKIITDILQNYYNFVSLLRIGLFKLFFIICNHLSTDFAFSTLYNSTTFPEKGDGIPMSGYLLVWILLQEIKRLNEELDTYKHNKN